MKIERKIRRKHRTGGGDKPAHKVYNVYYLLKKCYSRDLSIAGSLEITKTVPLKSLLLYVTLYYKQSRLYNKVASSRCAPMYGKCRLIITERKNPNMTSLSLLSSVTLYADFIYTMRRKRHFQKIEAHQEKPCKQ